MRNITWGELLEKLNSLPPERLQDTATIHDSTEDEFHGVKDIGVSDDDNDVLDTGHLFLTI